MKKNNKIYNHFKCKVFKKILAFVDALLTLIFKSRKNSGQGKVLLVSSLFPRFLQGFNAGLNHSLYDGSTLGIRVPNTYGDNKYSIHLELLSLQKRAWLAPESIVNLNNYQASIV